LICGAETRQERRRINKNISNASGGGITNGGGSSADLNERQELARVAQQHGTAVEYKVAKRELKKNSQCA